MASAESGEHVGVWSEATGVGLGGRFPNVSRVHTGNATRESLAEFLDGSGKQFRSGAARARSQFQEGGLGRHRNWDEFRCHMTDTIW